MSSGEPEGEPRRSCGGAADELMRSSGEPKEELRMRSG